MLINEKILLGIDLGTSTSSCCFFDPYSNKPKIIPFTNNDKEDFFFYSRATIKGNKILINPKNSELYTGDFDVISNKSNIDSRKARTKYVFKDKKTEEIVKSKFSPYDIHVEFLKYIKEKSISYIFDYLNQFLDVSKNEIEEMFNTVVIGVPQD
jgi:molecular chaperone DnaK (HSP70)